MSVDRYRNIANINNSDFSEPKISSYIPTPTEEDYKTGYIRRYFVRKLNDSSAPIYEVSSKEFNRVLSKPNYTGVSIKWRIKGPINSEHKNSIIDKGVKESNRLSIQSVSNEINLKLYLPNLLQFHK